MTQIVPRRPPRTAALTAARPRPTAAAALLLSAALSLPFVALAVVQALL